MFKAIRQYLPQISVSMLIIVSYFFLRLTRIMSLPLFTDETIYVRWSQIAKQDAAWRFISLTDGKQPMFVWWGMIFLKFFHDPLLAGRLVSVSAGILTCIGLFLLGREIFKNKWIGFITAGLYVLYPFALVYDRMALYDSLVGMFAVWSLYLEVVLVRSPRAWLAFVLALVLGGGMLTKTSNFFSIYSMPFTLLLLNWKSPQWKTLFLKWVGCVVLAVALANGYYLVLRLSPYFHIIGDKNDTFVYPLHDWIKHPTEFLIGNMKGLFDWFVTYITWPIIGVMITSLFIVRKYTKEKLVLIVYFAFPFFLLGTFGRILYPRFILFMTLPLLPLAALLFYALFNFSARARKAYLGIGIVLLCLVMWGRADYFIITDFARSPIPNSDLTQYSNDWPAGGGIHHIIDFLSQEAKPHTIFVASEGTFGSLSTYAVEIYLGNNDHVEKQGIWPIDTNIPADILKKAQAMPTYMIFNYIQTPPSGWPVKLVAKYHKGVGSTYISLYQVIPPKDTYEATTAK